MRTICLLIFVSSVFAGCKTSHALNTQSSVRSVVDVDKNDPNKIYVYFMDKNDTVFRKSCNRSQITTPENCPTIPSNAMRDWQDYRTALVSEGLSITTANGIGESLRSSTAWDGAGSQNIVLKMEAAFGVDLKASATPFPQAFIGAPQNGSVQIPDRSTTSMTLAIDLVTFEMKDAFDYFDANDKNFRGGSHPFPSDAIVSAGVQTGCFGNATSISTWSDIVFHYYCQFGQLRGCFTGKVSGGPKTYDHYKKGYDECLAGDSDFKRYFEGNVPGVDYDQRRAVFQHVMFSVYAAGGTGVFDRKDQDKAINARYQSSAGNCSPRPHLPRPSSDPLFRPNGQHCEEQNSVVVNPGGNTGGSKGICATASNGLVQFQIAGVSTSKMECLFKATSSSSFSSFSGPANFDAGKGRWICSDWSGGNPGYDIRITLDGNNFDTTEPKALANPCP